MLEIRQYAENVWEHVDTVRGLVFSISAFNFDLNNGIFQIKEINGQNRFAYNRSQIRVFPLGGGEESFSTDLALHQRLRDLKYTPFQFVVPEVTSEWEVVNGALQNKDNSLNMLFRFLENKGLTIEAGVSNTDWKVLRLVNASGERFSLTQSGRMVLERLGATDFVESANGYQVGIGNFGIIRQVQYQNSLGGNVRSLQFAGLNTASSGGGMAEAAFESTDEATINRPLRFILKKELDALRNIALLYKHRVYVPTTPVNTSAETLVATIPIPANTYGALDKIRLFLQSFRVNGGSPSTIILRVRIGTTSSFSTSLTQLAIANIGASQVLSVFVRNWRIQGGNLFGANFTQSILNDESTAASSQGSIAYNNADNAWLFVSLSVVNAGDTGNILIQELT